MKRITATVAAASLLLLAACSDDDDDVATDTVAPAATARSTSSDSADGPSATLGNGKVWTYVIKGADGKPVEVGVRLTGAALEGLAQDMNGMHPMPTVLSFPSGSNTGVLNHVEFY